MIHFTFTVVMDQMLLPTGNGEPGIAVSAPVAASMVKPETPTPATYRNLPDTSAVVNRTPDTGTGGPGIGVSAPFTGSIVKPETVES